MLTLTHRQNSRFGMQGILWSSLPSNSKVILYLPLPTFLARRMTQNSLGSCQKASLTFTSPRDLSQSLSPLFSTLVDLTSRGLPAWTTK